MQGFFLGRFENGVERFDAIEEHARTLFVGAGAHRVMRGA